MAIPVVAYRATALPETVRDGETGLLVDPGDDEALARAHRELLDDASLRLASAPPREADVRARFDRGSRPRRWSTCCARPKTGTDEIGGQRTSGSTSRSAAGPLRRRHRHRHEPRRPGGPGLSLAE